MEILLIKYVAMFGAVIVGLIALSVAATREVDLTILHTDLDSNLLRSGAHPTNASARLEGLSEGAADSRR